MSDTPDDNKPPAPPPDDLADLDLGDLEAPAAPPPPQKPDNSAALASVSRLLDENLDSAMERELEAQRIKKEKNFRQIMYGVGAALLLITLFGIYSCQPKKGSMAYGICSTFLELNTPYPETLRFTDLEGSRTAVRIYFTNIDPFGEFKQEMIECTFGPDEKMGMKLAQVMRNRRLVDPELVREFNLTLPTIMASDPYLVLPPDWRNQLIPEYYY